MCGSAGQAGAGRLQSWRPQCVAGCQQWRPPGTDAASCSSRRPPPAVGLMLLLLRLLRPGAETPPPPPRPLAASHAVSRRRGRRRLLARLLGHPRRPQRGQRHHVARLVRPGAHRGEFATLPPPPRIGVIIIFLIENFLVQLIFELKMRWGGKLHGSRLENRVPHFALFFPAARRDKQSTPGGRVLSGKSATPQETNFGPLLSLKAQRLNGKVCQLQSGYQANKLIELRMRPGKVSRLAEAISRGACTPCKIHSRAIRVSCVVLFCGADE